MRNGKTPAEWSPSVVFDTVRRRQGRLRRLHQRGRADARLPRRPSIRSTSSRGSPAVQAEVNRLRSKGVKTIIVIGHDGATAGTLTNPTGPLIDLADQLTGVDAVIGDHTNFQVDYRLRPNGTLVTENLSKGARFTRVRLVVDSSAEEVVYKTADFHKPWTSASRPIRPSRPRSTTSTPSCSRSSAP